MMKLLTVVRYGIKQPGWLLALGILLTVISAVLYVTMLIPATLHLRLLDSRLVRLQDIRHSHVAAAAPSADLHEFYRLLPPQKSLPELLEKIFDAANESGVALTNGQFKLTSQPQGKFSKCLVALSVSGSYGEVRQFADLVLQTNHAAALQAIDFSRSQVAGNKVESKVHFTLYLGVPGA